MKMRSKKIARYLIALFVIFSLNFIIPRLMPGDPITNLLGEDYVMTEESLQELREKMGLDESLPIQYLNYWNGVFRFDFGYSYHFKGPVSSIILSRMKWTLLLLIPSILFSAILGSLMGSISGQKSSSNSYKTLTLIELAFYSTPTFFLSLIFLYIFSFKLGLFPIKGFYYSGGILDILHHFFLPISIMTIFLTSRNYMIMRGSVIQEKSKLYVVYAKAKGLSDRQVLFKHIFKNASLPLLTLLALDFGFILSGALFIEIIFSMNGMGNLIYEALLSRDYPVLYGSFMIISIMAVLANAFVDFLYGIIDPRISDSV
ncbi:MAG: dipeptide transporter permease DppB [Candidatus Methanofastidiosum methylothiophilum]|uniref:Dipeptide transporter permease DppB n=1 Tax=Candidatus Methanofastidiosum methylothiophilum TaxID=1705564 RepID=A0A150JK65_9EURY|nr:MAG: dipeptide transporter permease DppB [Candidatus Methanofastidiosum methylthiophilus]OQC52256.1 MAG: dipeptide transporter permease DppB [Euryarchaeota archaeon ADurb.Bin023]HNV93633.1 ABC transporter permease [Methanofastidiosum sp.]KYC57625.1 MAG: dipeptide transporter permease DppB [Candidatus Methanofastidiosum methylthiophilus]KYC58486.1 MAG: dipeptide transporter permease DppB [Candidatus Methanofastidiosum methylthiophilus]